MSTSAGSGANAALSLAQRHLPTSVQDIFFVMIVISRIVVVVIPGPAPKVPQVEEVAEEQEVGQETDLGGESTLLQRPRSWRESDGTPLLYIAKRARVKRRMRGRKLWMDRRMRSRRMCRRGWRNTGPRRRMFMGFKSGRRRRQIAHA